MLAAPDADPRHGSAGSSTLPPARDARDSSPAGSPGTIQGGVEARTAVG
ncbi:hypothetical protein OHA21_23185 [Actinoplanes sp. NBC_00393]